MSIKGMGIVKTIINTTKKLTNKTKEIGDKSAEIVNNLLSDNSIEIEEKELTIGNKKYNFLMSGDPESDYYIIHIHGLVGNMKNFEPQMSDKLFEDFGNFAPGRLKDMSVEQKIKFPKDETVFDEIIAYFNNFISGVAKDKKIFLHGISLGGEIAYKYAAQYPENIAGVILSGASGIQEEIIPEQDFKPKNKERIQTHVENYFHDPKLREDIVKELTEQMYELLNDHDQSSAVLRLGRVSKTPNKVANRESLRKIAENKIPVNLLRGEKDPITPTSLISEFKELTSTNEVSIYPHVKHIPNMDVSAREYNQSMKKFLMTHTKDKK